MDPVERRESISELRPGQDHYDRDYVAILYSHAFRRLRHKTQVFFMPQNDHICTRLDHVLYVSSISETVCRALQEKGAQCAPSLARTIGIGHDLGHPPFGHVGEEVLNELTADFGGFHHETHGLRIVDLLEKPRDSQSSIGLNLTVAVRDGIINHCGEDQSTTLSPTGQPNLEGNTAPCTLEGCIVRLVDKVAYLGRDLEDAVTAGFIDKSMIPARVGAIIGTSNGEVVDYFVKDMVEHSRADTVRLSAGASSLMKQLMSFNYKHIYKDERIKCYAVTVKDIMRVLFEKFKVIQQTLGDDVASYITERQPQSVRVFGKYISDRKILYFREERYRSDDVRSMRIVADFLSTLTDRFALDAIQEFYSPRPII